MQQLGDLVWFIALLHAAFGYLYLLVRLAQPIPHDQQCSWQPQRVSVPANVPVSLVEEDYGSLKIGNAKFGDDFGDRQETCLRAA